MIEGQIVTFISRDVPTFCAGTLTYDWIAKKIELDYYPNFYQILTVTVHHQLQTP